MLHRLLYPVIIPVLCQVSVTWISQLHNDPDPVPGTTAVDEFFSGKSGNAVFSGRAHTPYEVSIGGTPYYNASYFTRGSIDYSGLYIESADLLWDIFRDEMIARSDGSSFAVTLDPGRVGYVEMNGQRIVHFDQEGLPAGYYVILSHGDYLALHKPYAAYFEEPTDGGMHREFIRRDRFYIAVDGKITEIRNRKTLTRLFPEHRQRFDSLIREHSLDYKKDPVRFMTVLLTH